MFDTEEHLQQQHVDSRELKKEKKSKSKLKSKISDSDEIEIDLNAQIPLSKKQQRQLKKGKLDLEKLARKNPPPKPETSTNDNNENSEDASGVNLTTVASKKSPFGVWIGNLSFDTTREDLIRFIVGKTTTLDPKITEEDITRVNIPKKGNQIKGFAYVDVPSSSHVETIVGLSESILNGRKLLIKDANSFEGRPEQSKSDATQSGGINSSNPPSRILFVGNLSFDTTEDLLEEHFRHCGEIVKIRMATFQDTGKCKGFAFIDFKDEEGATTALKSKLTKMLINRKLRMEYGEDRSKRRPKRANDFGDHSNNNNDSYKENNRTVNDKPEFDSLNQRFYGNDSYGERDNKKRQYRERNDGYNKTNNSNKRMKSSVALASAQRASVAIVPSAGKKIKFD